jgi:hypothetical protein
MRCINFATAVFLALANALVLALPGAGRGESMRKRILSGAMLVVVGGAAIAARPMPSGTPSSVQSLLACRSIADSAQRLACYDRTTGPVAQAIERKDLVLIDKERASAAKRSLFGFSVPDFAGLLGGGDVKEIQSTVSGITNNLDGGWTIKLADASVWTQTDDTPVALPPRRGDKVIVRRGTLGSYFLRLGSQPGFKVRRIA